MVCVARAGLRGAQHGAVQPRRTARPHATGDRGIAHLDAVNLALGSAPAERAQGALADREREVRERVRDDGDPAGGVDPRDRLGESGEHGDLVLDPERQQVAGPRRHLDAEHDLDLARPAARELADRERAADVVVVGERDDVEPCSLGGVEDLLDRRQPVAEIAVYLHVGAARHGHTRSKTVHCSGNLAT